MTDFTLHTLETAPSGSLDTLRQVSGRLGFTPNLYAVMAEAPPLLNGYLALSKIFDGTSLTPSERQVVLLAASHVNGCSYCLAAHGTIARMQKVPEAVVAGASAGTAISEPKLEALRALTEALVSTRGNPSTAALDAFFRAGYSRSQLLEVVLGVGLKTLSNYTNHLAHTPVDTAFQAARAGV